MLRAPTAIREAADDEIRLAADLLRRVGFGGTVGRLLEWPRRSPAGAVLLLEDRGQAVGTASCASFGATGWIGALGVAPEARRRGLGTQLTEACCAWLHEQGAQTVLLYATDLGRPVYERLGFEAESRAIAWRGIAGRAPEADVARLTEGDRAHVVAVDAAMAGEDRSAVFDALRPLHGLRAPGGFAVPSAWGTGAAVVADTPRTGVALMAAATRGPSAGTLVVPEDNDAAAAAVREWGFGRLNDALRMRKGPAPARRPERQFALFNLFWG